MQWASESSSGRLALEPAPPGHVVAPDPYAVNGGSGGRRRSRTPMGSEVSAVSSDLPLLRGTWRLWTHPQAGKVRGRWPGEGRAWPVGPGYSVISTQLRITTRVLPCRSKSGYPCYRVPTLVKQDINAGKMILIFNSDRIDWSIVNT